ncbi:Organic Anion Transporter Polypeptide family protein [Aphelenchoides fujianensis]|nr:Organic Anion Transporter Polypeptide family protein [Aphelenchoides fujianensis]
MNRLYIFLALFAFVLAETIGNTYTVASIQSIERQFGISSKLSGFLVSAHELSYVPTVIFISYYGSRGNRAKWIGVGVLIMAVAKIIIASSNFLFPVVVPQVNLTLIEERILPAPLIHDRIPMRFRDRVLERLEEANTKTSALDGDRGDQPQGITYSNHTDSFYSIDEPLISQALAHMDSILRGTEDERPLLDVFRDKNRVDSEAKPKLNANGVEKRKLTLHDRHVKAADANKTGKEKDAREFSECDCAPGGVVKKEYCRDNCRIPTILFFITRQSRRPPARFLSAFRASPSRLFGTLPSPILWGAIIDSSCMVWDSVCGQLGTCIMYNPEKLRVRMHVTYACIRLISTLNDLYVLYHAKDLNLLDEDEQQAEKTAAENIKMNEIPE